MSALGVTFCGEVRTIRPGEELTFGRSADLCIDDNPYLHRVIGRCRHRRGWWWLANLGSSLPLHLRSGTGTAQITLSPGGVVPLVLGPTAVRFAAGRTAYELFVEVLGHELNATLQSLPVAAGEPTIDAASLPLSPEDLLLLIALAASRLRKGPFAELPSNQAIIEWFGWSTAKFNRKLDHLCQRFARRGIDGLVAKPGHPANSRRSILTDHVIASGMITAELLTLLPAPAGDAHDHVSA